MNLAGKSKFEVETYIHDLDSVHINQRDSSAVEFEISPDLKTSEAVDLEKELLTTATMVHAEPGAVAQKPLLANEVTSHSWATMFIKSVDANVKGVSILDLGHAQIDNFKARYL